MDAGLATFVSGRPEEDRSALAERALRIGLIALQDAGTSLDVEVVRREFEAMLRQAETINERVAAQVDEALRLARLARLMALSTLNDTGSEVDSGALHAALLRVSAELDALRGLKTKLTTIGTAADAVNAGLDQMRDGVVARIAEAEAELKLDSASRSR